MYECKDCSGSVHISKNPESLEVPRYRVACDTCLVVRDVDTVPLPLDDEIHRV